MTGFELGQQACFYSYPSRAKKQWWLLIIGNSQGAEGSAVTQTCHSETPRSKSITATTPLSLNITLRLHSELAVERSGGNEAEHGHKEKDGEEKEWKVNGANQEKWVWMAHSRKKWLEERRWGFAEMKDLWKDGGGWKHWKAMMKRSVVT